MKRLLLILIATLLCFNANAKKHPAVAVTSPDQSYYILLDWTDGTLKWCAASYNGPYDAPFVWVYPSRLKMETSVGTWGDRKSVV